MNESNQGSRDSRSPYTHLPLWDFNSKHKQFGCVRPNKFGQTLVNIAKDLKLFYANQLGPNRHTREDPVHGTSDILDMAFLSPGLREDSQIDFGTPNIILTYGGGGFNP